MDKAPAHNAKSTRAAVANMGMELLDWPGNSPDLNPIEGVWSLLKERINKLRPKPYTRKQIEEAIQKEWDSLKPVDIEALIDSMPARIQAVLAANGGSTRY